MDKGHKAQRSRFQQCQQLIVHANRGETMDLFAQIVVGKHYRCGAENKTDRSHLSNTPASCLSATGVYDNGITGKAVFSSHL